LCRRLGIRPGETTVDGRLTLECAECLGACDFAPAALSGDVLLKNLTKEKIDRFLDSLVSKP
jgi:NADH-quinone oxidoreductase subunit E